MAVEPAQVLAWFVLRWHLAVPRAAVRRHRGVATQRQRSDLAIRRTTPALPGRCARVALAAQPHLTQPADCVRQATWSRKALPTFADALALVRQEAWAQMASCRSTDAAEFVHVPRALVERFADALCYAA